MKILDKVQRGVRGLGSICLLAACTRFSIAEQRPADSQTPIFQVRSSLVLVDVISQDHKSGLPIKTFKEKDFRLFDNTREVKISPFAAGAFYETRPIRFGFGVICKKRGLPNFG